MKDYDTIYLFVKNKWQGKRMKAGKASSQVAHAVGLLAMHYPMHWLQHVSNGQRAVSLKCEELPLDVHIDNEVGNTNAPMLIELNTVGSTFMNGWHTLLYASVYDFTDEDVFVLAVLPQKRLNKPDYDIL